MEGMDLNVDKKYLIYSLCIHEGRETNMDGEEARQK